MCAITGLAINVKDKDNKTGVITKLKELFTSLLLKSQSGGTDATGVAILNEGFDVTWAKNGMSAASFVKTEQYKQLLERVGPKTKAIIGHCRGATEGFAYDNKNNHPHIYGSTLGVHHGVIKNYKELAKDWALRRETDCDSEVVIASFDLLRDRLKWAPSKIIKFMGDHLQGSCAFALFNKLEGDKLILFRDNTNLELMTARCVLDKSRIAVFNNVWANMNNILNEYKDTFEDRTMITEFSNHPDVMASIESPERLNITALK